MKKRTIFNVQSINKIIIKNKKKSTDFVYKLQRKRFFGVFKYPEGFYTTDTDTGPWTKESLEKGAYYDINFIVDLDNRIVCFKPYVQITLNQNKDTITKQFNTFEEALEYGNELAKKHITEQLIIEE